MSAETPAAAKAVAESDAATKMLEEKKATRPKPDAQEPAPSPAAAKAVAESDELAARASRVKSDAAFRAKTKRLYETFQAKEVNLGAHGAAVLTAHVLLTADRDPEHMGRTEAIAWAQGFARRYPIVWASLRTGNLVQFVISTRRAGLETGGAEDLARAVAVIRG